MARVAILSAGGAVTPPAMIRDVIVHEEYRNKGVNDIGTAFSYSTAQVTFDSWKLSESVQMWR